MELNFKDNNEFIDCSNYPNLLKLPKKIGVYLFYNLNFELMYIGKAREIAPRVRQHIRGSTNTKYIKHNFNYIKYIEIPDLIQADIYETILINELKPKLNLEKAFTYNSEYYKSEYNPEYHKKQDYLCDYFSKLAINL